MNVKPMNLLFTSSGRRGYLLDYFRSALDGRGEIHAANSDQRASSFLHADKSVVTPLIYDENYIPFLLEYSVANRIKAIIPLFDIDLPILASAKTRFAEVGTTIVVSSPAVAMICNDKLKTDSFLRSNGFNTPASFTSLADTLDALARNLIEFPLVVKPRWGMGSIGVNMAENEGELIVFYEKVRREVQRSYLKYESNVDLEHSVLIQQVLKGHEYGLDVVNDLDGNYVTTFVKKKLAMRAGETDAAITIDSDQLKSLGKKLAGALGHIGNLDVDIFVADDNVSILELNNRFGGGYPFSHLAGADIPQAILAWIRGEQPAPEWLHVRHGVTGTKDLVIRCLSD
ncbi:Carbamoyl-phosphate synthase large chain [Novipirellula aureliae]|uniref:Carbamoyl-phosphate synthase large chain n=1 Tax=Novipirellula aureliae TaxID=2527966 RepID=A0A5C6DLK2_9BACT|nr:ATP-grasp domain-containing protein [Novipirellula aureliae]TWU37658.1 Carbamoyl-phosphate synthase large chain [Novipirellula aureliae]